MPYTSIVTRGPTSATDADALIAEEYVNEVIQGALYKSAVLQMARKVNVSHRQTRQPMIATKPIAYWVNGDTGLKQTTDMSWQNVYLNVEELACLIPIPENLIDDADFDLWAEIKPQVTEALAVAVDDAVIFGTNAPSTFPTGLVPAALANSPTHVINRGASAVDIADDLNNVMGLIEADGYRPTGWIHRPTLKAVLRGLRDTQKGLIFQPRDTTGIESATFTGRIWGLEAHESIGGLAGFASGGGAGKYEAVLADWGMVRVGIRQDITMKVFDQGVVTDDDGNIIFNTLQQDLVVLRVKARYGWNIPVPPSRLTSTPYPVAALRQT